MSQTVLIPLGRKKEFHAEIDAHHLPLVSKFSWSLHEVKKKNVVKRYARCWNKGKPFYMHRLLKGFPAFKIVDHRNGDGLKNTDENLRITNYSVNNYNTGKPRRGVYPLRCGWRWRAIIKDKGKGIHLGTFTSAESAAEAMAEVRAQLIEAAQNAETELSFAGSHGQLLRID